jgi:hypothetical protein
MLITQKNDPLLAKGSLGTREELYSISRYRSGMRMSLCALTLSSAHTRSFHQEENVRDFCISPHGGY